MIKRILVVEDQEDNRRILRDLLTSADYGVTEAENGEEALAAVAKQPPDLILMDIQLPIMDGSRSKRCETRWRPLRKVWRRLVSSKVAMSRSNTAGRRVRPNGGGRSLPTLFVGRCR
jgi:CheY-like chemotaxis protein